VYVCNKLHGGKSNSHPSHHTCATLYFILTDRKSDLSQVQVSSHHTLFGCVVVVPRTSETVEATAEGMAVATEEAMEAARVAEVRAAAAAAAAAAEAEAKEEAATAAMGISGSSQ